MKVEIIKEQGVFYINGKRLGHDILSDLERVTLNEFIREYKESQKPIPDGEAKANKRV